MKRKSIMTRSCSYIYIYIKTSSRNQDKRFAKCTCAQSCLSQISSYYQHKCLAQHNDKNIQHLCRTPKYSASHLLNHLEKFSKKTRTSVLIAHSQMPNIVQSIAKMTRSPDSNYDYPSKFNNINKMTKIKDIKISVVYLCTF